MQPGERLLVKPISKCDSSTQTDTHLVETNIVKSYEWNEWRLRWKAMQLVSRSVSVHPERLTFVVKSGCLNQLLWVEEIYWANVNKRITLEIYTFKKSISILEINIECGDSTLQIHETLIIFPICVNYMKWVVVVSG